MQICPRFAHDDWMNDGPACKLAKTIQHILRITKRAQWQSSNNDFPFFGPRQDPKNEKPFVAAPLRDSLSRPLRSSSFGRNARWNLNLGSRFTNRKSKKKRKKKGTKSRKLSAHGRPTIAMIILRTCTESRAQRSFRKQITTATAKFEKSRARPRNEWPLTTTRLSLTLDLSNLFSWNRLSRENASTKDCDNLPSPTYL